MLNQVAIIPSIPPPKTAVFRLLLYAILCIVLQVVTGCGTMPQAGPRAASFEAKSEEHIGTSASDAVGDESLPFVLVDVNRKILESLNGAEDTSFFKGEFTDQSAPTDVTIGVGDTLRVTIFEAAAGGLFVPTGGTINNGNSVAIPDQEVDQSGAIAIPYADKDGDGGIIKVAGRRPMEVQQEIQQRLMNRAIEPQVIVSLVNRTSNLYSVIGDVNTPGRFSLNQMGTRILDALGAAGGPKGADYNTLLTLQRGKSSATARLSTLLVQSENNIFVQPGDVIAVKREERFYNVLGATRVNNRIAFDSENVTVADALAKSGGLNGDSAEPATVVVFRRENPDSLKTMGVKMESFREQEPIPTVYRFDFTHPAGMFLAQKLPLRNNDVLYVSTHPFNDVSKLMGLLRDLLLIKLIDN